MPNVYTGHGGAGGTNPPTAPVPGVWLNPPLPIGKIYSLVPKVSKDIGPIGKDHQAGSGNFSYSFKSIDDILDKASVAMYTHGVFVVPTVLDAQRGEKPLKNGGATAFTLLKVLFRFYADDGSFVECTTMGEGADSGDKSTNKAHTSAFKNALIETFAVQTNEPRDSEFDSPEAGRPQAPHQPRSKTQAPPNNPAKPPQGTTPPRSAPESPKTNAKPPEKKEAHQASPELANPNAKMATAEMKKKLVKLAEGHGWTSDHLRSFIKTRFDLDSSEFLLKEQYDHIYAAVSTCSPDIANQLTEEEKMDQSAQKEQGK